MFLMKSSVEQNNHYFDIFDQNTMKESFFEPSFQVDSTKHIFDSEPTAEKSYFKLFFRADDRFNLYKLERYDLLTYLGDIGGLADITIMISGFLSIIFGRKILQAALTN